MKQRKLAFVIILGLITFGIYDLYWLVQTRKEMIAKGHGLPSLWRVILYPLIGGAAAIALGVAGGKVFSILAILAVLGGFVAAIVFGVRFLAAYCRVAEQVTNRDLAYRYSFWMGVLLYLFRVGFIWEAIVQYHFNRIGAAPAAGVQPAVLPQPPIQPQNTVVSNPGTSSPMTEPLTQPSVQTPAPGGASQPERGSPPQPYPPTSPPAA